MAAGIFLIALSGLKTFHLYFQMNLFLFFRMNSPQQTQVEFGLKLEEYLIPALTAVLMQRKNNRKSPVVLLIQVSVLSVQIQTAECVVCLGLSEGRGLCYRKM